jgi:hypothetical protein
VKVVIVVPLDEDESDTPSDEESDSDDSGEDSDDSGEDSDDESLYLDICEAENRDLHTLVLKLSEEKTRSEENTKTLQTEIKDLRSTVATGNPK